MTNPPPTGQSKMDREVAEALRVLGAAFATLNEHRVRLPAPLVELCDAVHTLVNVEVVRQEGREPSAFDLKCEGGAWDTVQAMCDTVD